MFLSVSIRVHPWLSANGSDLMLEVDFHTHTHFSHCGIHSHLEILNQAKALGMKGVAVTDHGPALKGRVSPTLFDRFQCPVKGLRFFKGMECNVLNEQGEIDLPQHLIPYMDIVLVGIHFNIQEGLGQEAYTQMLLNVLARNPAVDVITHPNDEKYPVDFVALAKAAKQYGAALELNNSKSLLKRDDPAVTRALVKACQQEECLLAVGSDMHAIQELGLDEAVQPYLKDFPQALIVNAKAETAFQFIASRKNNKEHR